MNLAIKIPIILSFLVSTIFGMEKQNISHIFIDDCLTEEYKIFFHAVIENDFEKASSLITNIVDIDQQTIHNFTCLHLASRFGYIKMIQLLVDSGANIHACNKNDNTPLHCAAYSNQLNAIKVLIENGAKTYIKNKNGDTPLHSAAWKNNSRAIEMLAMHKVDINSQNNEGDTALHLAAWNNCEKALEELIKNNADIDIKNNDGHLPIDLALKKNYFNISQKLSQAKKWKNIDEKAKKLAVLLDERKEDLRLILTEYETHQVFIYEIERCIRTLNNLHYNYQFLTNIESIDSAAIMLPSNLPLYSLVIFGIVPSFMSKNIFIRPNSLLQDNHILLRIHQTLELESIFPNLHIVETDHSGFKGIIQNSELVVFTGNPANSQTLIRDMKDGSFLVINGNGHNPVVITENADIDRALEGTILLKGFNGGQDCAGPDAILVHESIAQEFIKRFTKQYTTLPTGDYNDTQTIIGPINRFTELEKFARIFFDNRMDIIAGGMIDYKNRIVFPTVIVRPIDRSPNFKEIFGPIAFIHSYKNDTDLELYFQDHDGNYSSNKMYVTVYGDSEYLSKRDDKLSPREKGNVGLILENKTIHEEEIGYKPYGGYSLGASGIIKKTKDSLTKIAMPILLPEIIAEYMLNKKDISDIPSDSEHKKSLTRSVVKGKEIDPIISAFKAIAQESFGKNLLFGFVFGSAAKGKLKIIGNQCDDLDTFVCLQKDDPEAKKIYLLKLAEIHERFNLKLDQKYPAEIVTYTTLLNAINTLDQTKISLDTVYSGEAFDRLFWVHAITDKKIGFIGNNDSMAPLLKKAMPYVYDWRNKIIEQLEAMERVPEHLIKKFPGLDTNAIVSKLSKFPAHLVIHLALNYDE